MSLAENRSVFRLDCVNWVFFFSGAVASAEPRFTFHNKPCSGWCRDGPAGFVTSLPPSLSAGH